MRKRPGSYMANSGEDPLSTLDNFIVAVLALGLLAGGAFAHESAPLAVTLPAPEVLQSVVNAMYNAEYDKALSTVQDWLKDHPGDVQAWNYLAEATLDQEMLKENLYSGAAFLNSGKVFKKRQEPLPPAFEKGLNEILDHAQQLEEERLQRNPKDEEALYWLGVTHSTRTEFLFAIERSYFSALREGKRAWDANERLVRMDPQCADAYLVIGTADYAVGLLPWYLRMVTSVAGIHGNSKRGIRELQRASQEGQYTRVDAKTVLIMIYERQKQYPQAIALLHELERKFPHNYLVDLEIGRIEKAEGNWEAAADTYDGAVQKYVRGNANTSHPPRALILFRAGEAHEHLGALEEALSLYHEAGNVPGKSRVVYQADLAAARLDRHFNHSDRARKEYQLVADSVHDSDLAGAARQALQELR